MTIGKGAEWGSAGVVPAGLVARRHDHLLADDLAHGRDGCAIDGSMAATIGCTRAPIEGHDGRRLPVDLMDVVATRRDVVRETVAVSHVVVRRPWWRGGGLGGEVHFVMNAQFLDGRDLVPRGHPNDGRVEVLTVGASMGARQRVLAWRRARSGGHLPHPHLSVRSTKDVVVEGRGVVLVVDGVRTGRFDSVSVRVRPDAGAVWI